MKHLMTPNDFLFSIGKKNNSDSADAGHKMTTSGQHINLVPLDEINGYPVRPGFYEINGATAIVGGINFTIHSSNATYCELLLFKRKEKEPFAVIPFPENYRIGNCYSMIVFGLDIENLEYAYRMDGPYNPAKGFIFDKNNFVSAISIPHFLAHLEYKYS